MATQSKDPVVRETSDKATAILEAALELFAARGYDGTPVPLIAERAGVGAGTIYRYFESKEVLVNVLYKNWRTVFSEALLKDVPAEATPRETFALIWKRMAGFQKEYPLAFAFLEFYHHPYLNEENRALTENMVQFLGGFVRRGQDQDIFQPVEPAVLIFIVLGSFVGLVRAEREGRIALSPETIADAEIYCWRAITTPATTA